MALLGTMQACTSTPTALDAVDVSGSAEVVDGSRVVASAVVFNGSSEERLIEIRPCSYLVLISESGEEVVWDEAVDPHRDESPAPKPCLAARFHLHLDPHETAGDPLLTSTVTLAELPARVAAAGRLRVSLSVALEGEEMRVPTSLVIDP